MKYINRNFTVEKVKVENLVKKFDTPIYCYSYKKLKTNIDNFKGYFKSFKPTICFAVKSNSNLHLLKEIRKLGCGADVVSIGELMRALKAGINPKKIVFSGVAGHRIPRSLNGRIRSDRHNPLKRLRPGYQKCW